MGWSRKPAIERSSGGRSPPRGEAYTGDVGAAGCTNFKKNLHSTCHVNHLGTMRNPAKGRSSLKRAWFVAVAVATVLLLASISPLSSSIPAALFYPWSPTNIVTSNLYANEVRSESRQLVWERRQFEHKTSIPVVSNVNSAGNAKDSGHELSAIILAAQGSRLQILDPNSRNETGEGSRSTSGSESPPWPAHLPYIEDVVGFSEGMDLLLVRNLGSSLHHLKVTACRYDNEEGASPQLRSEASIIDVMSDGRLAVRCTRPVIAGRGQNQTSKAWPRIEDISLEMENLVEEEEEDDDEDENETEIDEDENDDNDFFSSKSLLGSDIESSNSTSSLLVLPRLQKDVEEPYQWGKEGLVYMLQVTNEDVIVYAKGIFGNPKSNRKDADSAVLQNFHCVFEFENWPVQTAVTAAALEAYRCPHPDLKEVWPPVSAGTRVKVHLLYKGTRTSSVAYYEPNFKPVVDGEVNIGDSEMDFHEDVDRIWPNLDVGLLNMNQRPAPFDHDDEEGKKIAEVREQAYPKKKYLVCSCTMIWNMGKFLKEWVHYNSDLGVEKFFLYDNNSEDDIESVVSNLVDRGRFEITRTIWPWVKTQEAGFSHCAIEAQRECTWVLFTDVDEYIFPKRWLGIPPGGQASNSGLRRLAPGENTLGSSSVGNYDISPLQSLIEDTIESSNSGGKIPKTKSSSESTASTPSAAALKVGQISFHCRNFGPSGLTANPPQGVTQGYTCRDQRELRHKSLLYFPAVTSSLRNVIHHFFLQPGYRTVQMDARQVVVNHYKFQAWSEFKTKFQKRASTYVVDWKEQKNLGSRDRPEGLGSDATKPPDWETTHCEMRDTALKEYVKRRFGVQQGYFWNPSIKMPWELQ